MSNITRSISVLEYQSTEDGLVNFVHPGANDAPEDRAPRNDRQLWLSEEDYAELGEPRLLTVALYPGNVIGQLPDHDEGTMLDHTEICLADNTQFYVRGIARNGEPLWVSETYKQVGAARKHAASYGVPVEEETGVE